MNRTIVTKTVTNQNIELIAVPYIVDPAVSRQYQWCLGFFIRLDIVRWWPKRFREFKLSTALDYDLASLVLTKLNAITRYLKIKWFVFCLTRVN